MSYAIVYSSKTGNTKILADTLHDCLPQADCCYFGSPNPAAMEADTLYVGFWTDKGNADESTSDFLKQLHGKNIFLFGTAGFGGSKEYFDKILKKTDYCYGMEEVLGTYRMGRAGSVSSNKLKQAKYHWQLYHEIEGHNVVRSLYELGCWAWVKGTGMGIDKRKV